MSPKESDKIGTVYKDERKRLLGYIRNRIPDKVEAEDILQGGRENSKLNIRPLTNKLFPDEN
jgi:hypothetical protein